jgi:hypothetical protein
VIESEFSAESSPPSSEFPWPPREDDSVPNSLAATWQQSVFHPAWFFRRMPREFDFGWVLGYYIIIGVAAGGISLFWEMVLGPSLAERWLPAGALPSAQSPIIDFLLSPLFLLMALYIGSAVVHLFLLILRGANHGYGTSLRVFCFSAGPQLFAIVPFIGVPVGGIWSMVLTVIGLREAHQTTTGKALFAVLIPTFLLVFLAMLVLLAGALIGLGKAVG